MGAETQDGRPTYAPGESFKTGSSAKDERQAALIEWLITPEVERVPRTKTEFADQWGVSLETLRKDTKEPLFQRDLMRRSAEVNKVERVTDVMDSLFRHATGRDGPDIGATASSRVSAAKVWLDQVAKNVDASQVKDYSSMTPEELEAETVRIFKAINAAKAK